MEKNRRIRAESPPQSSAGRPSTGRIDRRTFLASGAALAGSVSTGFFQRKFGGDEPVRYPDPDIVVLDERFARYRLGNTPIQRLHTGTLWAEGPAWNGAGRFLVWSDIPNDVQLRWMEEDGHVSSRFRFPAGNSNGNTFDWRGRQISCEHALRRVVRYEHDGGVTVLADSQDGKPFNAPNDVVVHREDGSIWFTDPGYGGLGNYEGTRSDSGSVQPRRKEAIYRVDVGAGAVRKVADDPRKPNGLAFSPDFKKLYVTDTGRSHYPDAPSAIFVYDVEDGRLMRPRIFTGMELDAGTGFADGLDVDEDGNVWSSAGWVGDGYDGVHVFAPDGVRIGQIRLPEICSNLCFGGSKRNRLFMTASQSLYAVYVETRGAHPMGG